MEPRTMFARPQTRDAGCYGPADVAKCDLPVSPTIPRTIDGIEQNQIETLDLIARMENAIDGPMPMKGECGSPSNCDPGIMERLGGVNSTSLEIRRRLESILCRLVK